MNSRFGGARVASLMLAGLVLAGGCDVVARAQAPAPLPSSPLPARTIFLEYRELAYPVATFQVPVSFQETTFKREPRFGGRNVTRGILKFGNSTEHFLPFILDRSQGRLYLDLNRNRDLADDTNGVFTATNRNPGSYYQAFGNVPLTFNTPAGAQTARVNIGIYYFNGQVGLNNTFQVECRYYWSGRAGFRGRDYEFGLVDNLTGKIGSPEGGYLVLRSWADRDQTLSVQDNSLTGFPFARSLFFAGELYRLDWSLRPEAGALRYQFDLRSKAADLGDLKLTGRHINRLLLTQDGNPSLAAVLDAPQALERVPRGVYRYDLTVKAGNVAAHELRNWGPAANPRISVVGANAAILAAGGPLTNTVSVTHQGKDLALNYQLVGAGGQTYQLQGARKEPRWAVSRGGKQIAAGQFQFG